MMPRLASALAELEGRIFAPRRIRCIGAVLLAVNLAALGWALANGRSAAAPDGRPGAIDFAHFFVAASFADTGRAPAIYDYSVYSVGQRMLFGVLHPPFEYFRFLYPPTSLIFILVLGVLPYFAAFAGWVAGTFLLCAAAVCKIVPKPAMLIAAALPPMALKNAQLGQDGFLTGGLIGLSLATMETRPILAGVFLGLLVYKPHFGVLFPIVLLAARQWKVIAGAAATVAILAAIATAAFGVDAWTAYFVSLRGFDVRLNPHPHVDITFQSLFGLLRWYGANPVVALGVHAGAAILIAVFVCRLWRSQVPFALKAAALAIGAVAVTPYVIAYDLCILTVGFAFLVQDGLSRGFRPGERVALLLCFILSFLSAKPIGAVLCAVLLGITLWRARPARPEPQAANRSIAGTPPPARGLVRA